MNDIATFNADLLGFIDKSPRATAENIDFYYKSEYEKCVAALKAHDGKSIAIVSPSEVEMDQLLRRCLLLTDIVIFNVATYSQEPKPMLLPVPDDVASPVLGVNTIIDSHTRVPRFPTPSELLYVVTLLHSRGTAGEEASDFLGFEWGREGFEWRRTTYTRTSQPYKNEKQEDCHIAVGAGLLYSENTYKWLMQQARPLLKAGNIVFAPFLRVAPDAWGGAESLLKARYFLADVGATSIHLKTTDTRLHALLELDFPYFDGISLPLFAEILKDERDSFLSFRAALAQLVKNIQDIKDESKLIVEASYIRRNHIDPELSKLEGLIKRISKMRALRAAGCIVGSSAICLLSVLGIPPASLLLPAAGGIAANLMELAKRIEEEQKKRDNPMYFLWNLKTKRKT